MVTNQGSSKHKIKIQCQYIYCAFGAAIKGTSAEPIIQDGFQLFKIYFPIIQVSQYDFAPGSCNRPPIHASWNPALIYGGGEHVGESASCPGGGPACCLPGNNFKCNKPPIHASWNPVTGS